MQLLCDFFCSSSAYFRIDFLPTLLKLPLMITRKIHWDYASEAKINTLEIVLEFYNISVFFNSF